MKKGLCGPKKTVAEFLAKPKTMIKKTKMSFKGFKKEEDITNVIAYIATFSPDYVAETEEETGEKSEDTKETKTEG